MTSEPSLFFWLTLLIVTLPILSPTCPNLRQMMLVNSEFSTWDRILSITERCHYNSEGSSYPASDCILKFRPSRHDKLLPRHLLHLQIIAKVHHEIHILPIVSERAKFQPSSTQHDVGSEVDGRRTVKKSLRACARLLAPILTETYVNFHPSYSDIKIATNITDKIMAHSS